MAKAYLRQPWTDPVTGEDYGVNDEIDLPRETAEEKVTYDHLVKAGIVGRRPLGDDSAEQAEQAGQSPAVSAQVEPPERKGKSTRTSTTPR